MWLGSDLPRTHVLERIADLLPREIATTLDREALISLSPWAVAGRYPEDIADPSDDATTALVNAPRTIVGEATRSSGGGP